LPDIPGHWRTSVFWLRRCKAAARRFLELQQAAGIAQQHLAIIRQRYRTRIAAEQRPTCLELEALDLLAHRRLREMQPLRRAAEAAALGDRDEGAEQVELEHGSLI